jgi:hypothetical protein
VPGKIRRRNLVLSMSFSLYVSLQDVPVPGKIRRRNSVLSISFILYVSFQDVPVPGKIRRNSYQPFGVTTPASPQAPMSKQARAG